jgi:hypothetical protein
MTALSRRRFFSHVGRLVVLVPAGYAVLVGAGCGTSPTADCAAVDTVMSTGAALIVVSSCAGANAGHSHDFTIMNTDLATPPAAGVNGNTSPYDDDQHVHTVALTQAELQSIQAGGTVTKTSGTTVNHSHDFRFRKA